jgi:hypothetical protein
VGRRRTDSELEEARAENERLRARVAELEATNRTLSWRCYVLDSDRLRRLEREEAARRVNREKGEKAALAFLGVSRGDGGKGLRYPREHMAALYVTLRESSGFRNTEAFLPEWWAKRDGEPEPDREKLEWRMIAFEPPTPHEHEHALALVAQFYVCSPTTALDVLRRAADDAVKHPEGTVRRDLLERLRRLLPPKLPRKVRPPRYAR